MRLSYVHALWACPVYRLSNYYTPYCVCGGFGMGARKNRKRSQAKRRGKTSLKSYFCRGSSNIMSSRP